MIIIIISSSREENWKKNDKDGRKHDDQLVMKIAHCNAVNFNETYCIAFLSLDGTMVDFAFAVSFRVAFFFSTLSEVLRGLRTFLRGMNGNYNDSERNGRLSKIAKRVSEWVVVQAEKQSEKWEEVREIAWWVRATQNGGARKHEKKVFWSCDDPSSGNPFSLLCMNQTTAKPPIQTTLVVVNG